MSDWKKDIERKGKLEAESEAKSHFLAYMSHEIRTPMSGILTIIELLRKRESCADDQAFYMESLHSSIRGLLSLLNEALDFSKVDAGNLQLKCVPFHVREILAETQRIAAALAEAKNLHLSCTVSGEIPDRIWGDPLRLQQVLMNLATNAIKFTERGSVKIECCLTARADQHVELSFCVEDTGIGIAEGAQERIFEPFLQADESVSGRFGGTGLGLSICSQLVGLMGGKINVVSTPGSGSKFAFSLLFGIAQDQTLSTCGNVTKDQFSPVIVDNQVPRRNGLETISQIRESKPSIAILGSSADDRQAEPQQRYLKAGTNAYLDKPDSADELHAAIKALEPNNRGRLTMAAAAKSS